MDIHLIQRKICLSFYNSVGPQLLYPSPYAVTPPGLMQLHPQSHHQGGAGGLNSAAASAAVAAAVASGFYDYPTAAYAASQFAANGGFDTTFPFGGAAAAAAAAGKLFCLSFFLKIQKKKSRRTHKFYANVIISPMWKREREGGPEFLFLEEHREQT
jgi:hypothetical protein